MTIVRLRLGVLTGSATPSPKITNSIDRGLRYTADFETYLIGLYGCAIALQAHQAGSATPFRATDTVVLGCRQAGAEWYWSPEETLGRFAANSTPEQLFIERFECVAPDPNETMQLGSLSALLFNFGQSLGTNYFERYRPQIEGRFGNAVMGWPDPWKFVWAVRNAMAHGGRIKIDNENRQVAWRQLSYSKADNDKLILHTDL